jgi:hypothetical protein
MGIWKVGSRKLGSRKSGTGAWVVLVVAVLVVLGLVGTVQAQDVGTAQGSGVIQGRVVNGTAGGPEIGAGIAVSLHVLQGQTEGPVLETTTDANGSFRFEGLDTNPDLEYWPEAVYLDVPYDTQDPYQFQAGETSLDGVLAVYETTEDDGAVSLDSAHFIMESFGQVLRISEVQIYGNSGDRTYIGHADETGQRTTLFVPLPESAVGLAFDQEPATDRFVEVDGGFWDTAPVPPGQQSALVFFSYHLVVTGNSMPLERHFTYPVTTLNILTAEPGLTLHSDQLQAMGLQSFQGQNYDFFTLQGLAADTPLAMELLPSAEVASSSGMPAASTGSDLASAGSIPPGNQDLLRSLGLVLAGLAVVGAVIYALSSRRPAAVAAAAPNLAANARSRRLLAELADLEDAYAAGQLDDAAYERQRAEKYQALRMEVGN